MDPYRAKNVVGRTLLRSDQKRAVASTVDNTGENVDKGYRNTETPSP